MLSFIIYPNFSLKAYWYKYYTILIIYIMLYTVNSYNHITATTIYSYLL